MARRKAHVELAQLPTMDPVTQPVLMPSQTTTEERRDRELEELLDTIGSDGRLTVWHISDGKAVYAGNMTLDGFSLDALLDAYGGGDKSLVFYQGNKKVETIRVALDPAIPSKNPKQKTVTAAAAPVAPATGPSMGDISGLLVAMGQSQLNAMQMVQQMQAAGAANMQTMLTAITTLMTTRPAERDPVELMKAMLEVTKRGESSSSVQSKELLDMFERGMKLARDASGDDGDSVTGLIGEGVKTLGSLVEGIVAEKKANAERTRASLALSPGPVEVGDGVRREPIPLPVDESVSTTTPPEHPAWLPADTNVDALWSVARYLQPVEAATIINGRLSDEQFDAMITDMETPGFGDRLLRYFPVLKDVDPAWVGAVISTLLTYAEEGETDAATEGTHDATN